MFRNFFLLLFLSTMLFACDEMAVYDDGKCIENCNKQTENSANNKPKEDKKTEAIAPSAEDKAKQVAGEAVVLGIYQKNFEEGMEVVLEEETKTFKFYSNDQQFTKELVAMLNGAKDNQDWNGMVESFRGMSEKGVEILGKGYGIMVMNPVNPDKSLLYVIDGVVVYDTFNQ